MKTFNEKEQSSFEYSELSNTYRKRITLTPDYEISIIYGGYSYSSKGSFEIALYKSKKRLYLTEYEDIIGYKTSDEINDFMKLVQTTTDENKILQYFR